MNQINVLFFSILKERAGTRQVLVELPEGAKVVDLKDKLKIQFPGLEKALDTSSGFY